jgi:hypothetical protein
MPMFIIPTGGGRAQKWKIEPGETVIGRDESAGLCLPNVSVSRRHATLRLRTEQVLERDEWGEQQVAKAIVSVEDLESRNGIMVNDMKTDKATLNPGDVLRVGKFQLHLVEDGEPFWKGRATQYMSVWAGTGTAGGASTFGLDPKDVERMMRTQHIIGQARMVLATNQKRYWFPEESPLTFGSEGMIHVEGLRARGIVAEVTWDGNGHLITKKGMLAKVKINGGSVSSKPLASGDQVDICGTRFVYAIP